MSRLTRRDAMRAAASMAALPMLPGLLVAQPSPDQVQSKLKELEVKQPTHWEVAITRDSDEGHGWLIRTSEIVYRVRHHMYRVPEGYCYVRGCRFFTFVMGEMQTSVNLKKYIRQKPEEACKLTVSNPLGHMPKTFEGYFLRGNVPSDDPGHQRFMLVDLSPDRILPKKPTPEAEYVQFGHNETRWSNGRQVIPS